MFCDKCGKEVKKGDKFCNSCGVVVGVNEKKNYWEYLGYDWTVIVNLITIGVVFAIYGSIYEGFEVIVISLLILIYLSFQSFSMIYGKTTAETAMV